MALLESLSNKTISERDFERRQDQLILEGTDAELEAMAMIIGVGGGAVACRLREEQLRMFKFYKNRQVELLGKTSK